MIYFSKETYQSFEQLLYYPYTIGTQLEKASVVVQHIMMVLRSLPTPRFNILLTRAIPNIGTIRYVAYPSHIIIQDIRWSPVLTRFYYVKSNFITFSSRGNIPSVHPSMYTDRDERHFMCDNGYKVVCRKFKGKEYFNFKDTKGNIISDIDFTQVKPFSEYRGMTARGYTPNRRCYMVFSNGNLEEVNENKQQNTIKNKTIIRLAESDLLNMIKESVKYIIKID